VRFFVLFSLVLIKNVALVVINEHIVPSGIERARLSDYVVGIFPTLPSKKGVKKAIARGEVLVDGEITTTGLWVKPGQKIELLETRRNAPKEYLLDIEVVYEDNFLAVINKPAGIPVSGNQFRTIQNALIGNLNYSSEEDALRWPKPVHRLDNPTSGLLIIAKTAQALMKLGHLFEQREIKKKYVAVVMGELTKKGNVDSKIDGLDAFTQFEKMKSVPSLKNGFLSLVELYPETGRTHQLRIHMAEIGFPIVGDKIHGSEGNVLNGKGLFLAATSLIFKHPITQEEITINIDPPLKFDALLNREKRRWEKYH
jgi:RluA family pseudouridine synthase